MKNHINIRDRDLFQQLWDRIKAALFSPLEARVSALEEGGGGEDNAIESISLNGVNLPPDASKNVNIVALTAETDPTVPDWAKQPAKPTYTAAEVHALPDTTTIPSKTSDLTNDSGFITAADVDTLGFYIDAQGFICQRIGSDA